MTDGAAQERERIAQALYESWRGGTLHMDGAAAYPRWPDLSPACREGWHRQAIALLGAAPSGEPWGWMVERKNESGEWEFYHLLRGSKPPHSAYTEQIAGLAPARAIPLYAGAAPAERGGLENELRAAIHEACHLAAIRARLRRDLSEDRIAADTVQRDVPELLLRFAAAPREQPEPDAKCFCHHCIEERDERDDMGLLVSATRIILCPQCGNKRCPHASDHRLTCTGSNEPGQPGSIYPGPEWYRERTPEPPAPGEVARLAGEMEKWADALDAEHERLDGWSEVMLDRARLLRAAARLLRGERASEDGGA